jgi:hypothetical protein
MTDSILALNSESRVRVFTSTQVVEPLFKFEIRTSFLWILGDSLHLEA